MTEVLQVGIVGCGVGREHIRSYQRIPQLYNVVAVCDLDGDKARQVANQFNIPITYTNFNDLCSRQDLNIIDICTPPYQHYSQIMATLSSGKHAICEKPLVGSLCELDNLVEASLQHKKQVMPILQYRYGHGLQKLKLLVEKGIAGKLYLSTVEMAWNRGESYYASPWRGNWATELGGTLLNHAIHHLDMLCYIAGPVTNVFARTASLVNNIQVEDCASISLEMKNGSLAALSATVGSFKEISRHRFCFSNLTAESNSKPYNNSDDPWQFTGKSKTTNQHIESALSDYQAGYSSFEAQFTYFHKALFDGNDPPVTLMDARNLLEIMTAIYESGQTQKPVNLPISKENPRYYGWSPEKLSSISTASKA